MVSGLSLNAPAPSGRSRAYRGQAQSLGQFPMPLGNRTLIYDSRGRGGIPTLLSKDSLPARLSRETPVQTIERLRLLARLRPAPPCFFRESPCSFPKAGRDWFGQNCIVSHAVRSLGAMSRPREFARHSRGLRRRWRVSVA